MNRKEADLFLTVARLIEAHFRGLRCTVRKNLSRLTCAFLRLALSVRFGYGGLHLTSVARVLPQGVQFKSSYKWLSRFLKCPYFDPSSLAESMLALMLGQKPPPWVIVLVDQTTVDGVQVVSAAIPLQGRAVPVAWVDFEYPWKTLQPPSQNTLERYLLTWLGEVAADCFQRQAEPLAGFLVLGTIVIMPGTFRVRPVGLEGVGPPVDEEAKVIRHHTGGRFETKLPHSLLPEVRWTAPLLHVGGEMMMVLSQMGLLAVGIQIDDMQFSHPCSFRS